MPPPNCLIFKKCCKKIKKKLLQNTSINKNGSNESTKMRYSKVINSLPWPIPQIIRRLLMRTRDFINLFV